MIFRYKYTDYKDLKFDSYIIPTTDLKLGDLWPLEVDNSSSPTYGHINFHIHLIQRGITSISCSIIRPKNRLNSRARETILQAVPDRHIPRLGKQPRAHVQDLRNSSSSYLQWPCPWAALHLNPRPVKRPCGQPPAKTSPGQQSSCAPTSQAQEISLQAASSRQDSRPAEELCAHIWGLRNSPTSCSGQEYSQARQATACHPFKKQPSETIPDKVTLPSL